MTFPQAIVAAAALIAAGIAVDAQVPAANAQVDVTRGFVTGNVVAGDHLWWVEPGNKINRVYMCSAGGGSGPSCSYTDVSR